MLPRKEVPITELNVGDTFDYYREGINCHMASFKLISKEPDHVMIQCYDNAPEPVSNNAVVEMEYTEEELLSMYDKEVIELLLAMENQLYDEGEAVHEMWNGWTWDPSPAETAIKASQEGLHFIGWFYLKNPAGYLNCDIGVVAEYEDGSRIWCHAKKEWYDSWRRHFPKLYEIVDALA